MLGIGSGAFLLNTLITSAPSFTLESFLQISHSIISEPRPLYMSPPITLGSPPITSVPL